MKHTLVLALGMFSMFSGCANTRTNTLKIKEFPGPIKVSEMFTGEWRMVEGYGQSEQNKYIYFKGTLGDNKTTMVMIQVGSDLDKIKSFILRYARNKLEFNGDTKYLYLSSPLEKAEKAYRSKQNIIIITKENIPDIDELITDKIIKTKTPLGKVKGHLLATASPYFVKASSSFPSKK